MEINQLLPLLSVHFPSGKMGFKFKEENLTTPNETCCHGKKMYHFCQPCYTEWVVAGYCETPHVISHCVKKKDQKLLKSTNREKLMRQGQLLQFLEIFAEEFPILFRPQKNFGHFMKRDFFLSLESIYMEWRKTWHVLCHMVWWKNCVQSDRKYANSPRDVGQKTFQLCVEIQYSRNVCLFLGKFGAKNVHLRN